MRKRDALRMVPRLARMPEAEFSKAIMMLITRKRPDEQIEPNEILVALNRADIAEADITLLQLRSALDHCLRRLTDVFDQTSLAAALNKLVEMQELPLLFMRMVILSVGRVRALGRFVLGTLLSASVITDKIRSDKNQWRGYRMLLRQTAPQSYRHLLALPTGVMRAALEELPHEFASNMLNFVEGPDCDVRVPPDSLSAIRAVAEREREKPQTTSVGSGKGEDAEARGSKIEQPDQGAESEDPRDRPARGGEASSDGGKEKEPQSAGAVKEGASVSSAGKEGLAEVKPGDGDEGVGGGEADCSNQNEVNRESDVYHQDVDTVKREL